MFTILKVKTEEIPETDKLSNDQDDQDERRLFPRIVVSEVGSRLTIPSQRSV